MVDTKVSTNIDFERFGKQIGYLDIPSSRNESAWGLIRFPICVIRNGSGPTALFTGGNHGDEYEGPISLHKLCGDLEPAHINGRLIIIPMLNFPAVHAATRVSPIDGVNMNRAFPGNSRGTISPILADYVTRFILPVCDVVLDLHSGGKTMQFHPFACIHELEDKDLFEKARKALLAFGAPVSLVLKEIDSDGMLDTVVENSGKVFVAAEIGGGGSASVESIEVADRGVRNLLRHFGILAGNGAPPASGRAPVWETTGEGSYIHSNHSGLLELTVRLGEPVQRGVVIARIHSLHELGTEPIVYRAGRDGILIGRHFPGLVRQGDFLALIAGPVTGS